MTLGIESTSRVDFSVWGNLDNVVVVSNVLRVRECIPATNKSATLKYDLEIQGHVMLHFPEFSQRLSAKATNSFFSDAVWVR